MRDAISIHQMADAAVGQAAERLGRSIHETLDALDVSVALRCLALDAIARDVLPLDQLRAHLTDDLRARAANAAGQAVGIAALDAVLRHPRVAVPDEWRSMVGADGQRGARDVYFQRIAETAFERAVTEWAGPELRIAFDGAFAGASTASLASRRLGVQVGVIFVEPLGFLNEFSTLLVDALDGQEAAPRVQLAGVRATWLNHDGTARRAIVEDAQGGLVETDLETPLRLDGALFLCLGARERERHRELSHLLSTYFLLNPYAATEAADDKAETYRRLHSHGVKTPACVAFGTSERTDDSEAVLQQLVGRAAQAQLVLQPRHGTEGAGVELLEWDERRRAECLVQLARARSTWGDLVVRPLVGNVRFGAPPAAADLRVNVIGDDTGYFAESAYLQVARHPEDVASSVGRGGRIVKLSEGALSGLGITQADLDIGLREAIAAVLAVVPDDGARSSLWGVDVKFERRDGRLEAWVLDLNPRPSGLGYSELLDTAEPGVSRRLWQYVAERCMLARMMRVIQQDADERPEDLLEAARVPCLRDALELLRGFLRRTPDAEQPRIYLLQERAILLLGAILWQMRRRGALPQRAEIVAILEDVSASESVRTRILSVIEQPPVDDDEGAAYLAYVNQFLLAANEREMADFGVARQTLLARVHRRTSQSLRLKRRSTVFRAISPMRVGISSANASDNWTFSKLRGGMVVNFAVDLSPHEGEPPAPPIEATLEAIAEPVLIVETHSLLQTDRPTRAIIDRDHARDFFSLPAGAQPTPEQCWKDIGDPLLLLKYALAFSGIVGYHENPSLYASEPTLVLDDIARFTGGCGLRLAIRSVGPSRSGFASSSCVALSLLRVLYGASSQEELAQPEVLSSLALLLENEVGLKSGRQDTDGPLYPGLKALRYPPTTGFLEPELRMLEVNERALRENLVLVNSGIQRPAATGLRRGLNMRHYSYLSRDKDRFPAILASLTVHERIVESLQQEDWRRLGTLFSEYLDLRERIDPGATASVFDEAAGRQVLRVPFETLLAKGLIFGGMYTGAMGGGCMMLVPTPAGKEVGESRRSRVVEELEALRRFAVGNDRPFCNLVIYHYAIDLRGLQYAEAPT